MRRGEGRGVKRGEATADLCEGGLLVPEELAGELLQDQRDVVQDHLRGGEDGMREVEVRRRGGGE